MSEDEKRVMEKSEKAERAAEKKRLGREKERLGREKEKLGREKEKLCQKKAERAAEKERLGREEEKLRREKAERGNQGTTIPELLGLYHKLSMTVEIETNPLVLTSDETSKPAGRSTQSILFPGTTLSPASKRYGT